ncbi:hypothetical protein JW935_24830 [candidate division KSB1 bacterium]|nr:hypothetical protein [candidate division KSB1 bacterium]
MKTLNEAFMDSNSQMEASNGMRNIVRTDLSRGIRLYRFASSDKPELWYAGAWWLSFSPFEALKKYASLRKQSLTLAARQCLAIDKGWPSKLDILVEGIVNAGGLSAWSGTPETQSIKNGQKHIRQLRPDRDITQLFISGLDKPNPLDSSRKIWQNAFINLRHSHIGNR